MDLRNARHLDRLSLIARDVKTVVPRKIQDIPGIENNQVDVDFQMLFPFVRNKATTNWARTRRWTESLLTLSRTMLEWFPSHGP